MLRNMRETCREPSLCRSFKQYNIHYWWCYFYMALPISECIEFSLRTLILWRNQGSGIWFKVRLALKWIGKLFKGRGREGDKEQPRGGKGRSSSLLVSLNCSLASIAPPANTSPVKFFICFLAPSELQLWRSQAYKMDLYNIAIFESNRMIC